MANILLTARCNRSCPYCFAKAEMSESAADAILSWENLIYVADFLQAAGQRNVSLLGGEPTTHPLFVDFVLYLLERGFDITVFTNGILSPARMAEFKQFLTPVGLDRLNLVCNLNDPVLTPASPQEERAVQAFLALMGPWTTPGFNIYRLDFTLDFLFDAINRFGLKRSLRLGLAHPIPGQRDGFVAVDDIRRVIQRLYSYRHRFDDLRVRPGLDCGFPICAFDDAELGWLHRFRGASHFWCGPAFDIAPDMSLYHCFPLADYQRRSLFEFDSMQGITDHFAELRSQLKAEIAGIYPQCDGCRHLEDEVCSGGGLCQTVRRFIDEAPVRLPEIENALAHYRLPR